MTDLAKIWAGVTYPTAGVALKAGNEADANAWKRFYSTEGPADPYISLTWNRPPNKPDTVQTNEAVAYAAPGETTSSMYSASLRPWVRTKATDPDANTVKYIYEFFTGSGSTFNLLGTCTSSVNASGTTAGCRPSADLPDNTLLYVRAKANDGRVDGPWTSYQSRLRIGTQTPVAPVVNCPAPYADGTWQDTAPTADVVCTVTATGTSYSAPGYIRLTVDGKPVPTNFTGGAAGQVKITPSSDPAIAKTTVTIPKTTPGLHTITARAETPAGKLSGTKTHSFGWGGTALTQPAVRPRVTTTGAVKVEASGPPRGQSAVPAASVRWRLSGYGSADESSGWNIVDPADAPLTVTDQGAGGVVVKGNWDTGSAVEDVHVDSDPETPAIEPIKIDGLRPVLLDVQVCLAYTNATQCTWSESRTTVTRVPHAFGGTYPTAVAGPGEVALWTGEFRTDETDFEVPGYTGRLELTRSHTSFDGAKDGVFGPGWSAAIDGSDVGAASLEVIDNSQIDATIVLADSSGPVSTWRAPSGKRRTTAGFETGAWTAVTDDGFEGEDKLVVSGSGASTAIAHTDTADVVTKFVAAAAPTSGAAASFRALTVDVDGKGTDTVFGYDATGRLVRLLAPAAPGLNCSPTGALVPGCRALRFGYGTSGGEAGRLTGAWLEIYDPARSGGAGMTSVQVAAYGYDAAGRLVRVTDPRSALGTEYGYDGRSRLTSVKPAGQQPFRLAYADNDDKSRLAKVERDRPTGDAAGGTATLATFVYDVPLSGPGLPDVTTGAVGAWNQRAVAERGLAVFGPDHPLAGSPTETDWQYADLQYADAQGATVNKAAYGAGEWQLSATDYNERGQVVRALDERALRLFRSGEVGSADQVAELTVYNDDIRNAADEVVTPAGLLVTDTYAPARMATVGSEPARLLRTRVHKGYDEKAPNGGINPETSAPYWLLTSETTTANDPGTGQDVVLARRLTDYGDAAGWAAGLAARSAIDVDQNGEITAADQVVITKYDAEDRLVESRQPGSAGTDAGTTKFVYYSGDTRTDHPECGERPYWAGLHCKSYPAGTPSSSVGATPTLPTVASGAYNYLLIPIKTTETSASVIRTITRTYTADGDPQTIQTQVVGLTGSTRLTKKAMSYNATTGLAEDVTATAADGSTSVIRTRYDSWGREISYQSGTDSPATTTYDAAGRVSARTDANGATTYTYDGLDATGRAERRGLPTKAQVTSGGSTWSSTGAYDAAGALITQKLPGGISQYADLDVTGRQTGLRYTGQVVVTDAEGNQTAQPDRSWLAWSRDYDLGGRVSRELTPDGAAFAGAVGDAPGDAVPYDRAYTYDAVGRLTEVRDRTAATTGVDVADPAEQPGCVTRRYTFDANDNRLGRSTAGPAADGTCQAGGTEQNRLYDTADRIVRAADGTSLYTYDQLGRNTVLPAADAPHPERGDVRLGYYDNDLIRSISQGDATTTYALDAADRRTVDTATNSAGSTETVRHYTDAGDSPTWIQQGTTTERLAGLLGDGLDLAVSGNGSATLQVLNPHGDVVSTVELAAPSAVGTSVSEWQQYDEYGNTSATSRYGWIGGHQREVGDAGLSLMGVRVYNPVTGAFTSNDPVMSGGANRYAYPTDPVNLADLTGKWWHTYWTVHRNWGLFEFFTYYYAATYGIPFPKPTSFRARLIYRVYAIRYLRNGKYLIWKYGITSVGDSRYRDQIPKCRRGTGNSCTGKWLVRNIRGYYKARVWESYFITVWAMRHGGYRHCPPGQPWPSCR